MIQNKSEFSRRPFPYLSGIFLISCAALTFQIGLTRIFSISQWYHFAFMIISLALLGFGASGSFLAVFPSQLKGEPGSRFAILACLFAVTSLLSYIVANKIPFDSFRLAIEPLQIVYLVIIYLSLSAPFFIAGLLIGTSLVRFAEKANVIYFFNLLGSGAGCFLVLLIPVIGGAGKIPVLVACIGLAASFMFSTGIGRENNGKNIVRSFLISTLTAFVIIAVSAFCRPWLEVTISPYKSMPLALRAQGARSINTKENSISRVDIIRSPVVKYAPGLSYAFDGSLPNQLGITIDGENLTGITVFKEWDEIDFTGYLPGDIGYRLMHPGETLIIEPHGGLEVLSALYRGGESVTVVESNPLIVEMIMEDCSCFVKEPYYDDRVKIVNENARAYLRGTDKKFDLVMVSLSDSFGAVTSGAFSLRQEHLYTVEAIKDYLNVLSPEGILVITRWLQTPPSECIRLGATVLSALEEMKFPNPAGQFAFIRGWMTGTFIAKNRQFNNYELDIIRKFCTDMKFDVVWLPGIQKNEVNIYNSFPEARHYNYMQKIIDRKERGKFFRKYAYNVSPVRDNCPFFFHFFKWKQTPLIIASLGKRWLPYGGGGYLVVVLIFVISVLCSFLLIILPLCIRHRNTGCIGKPLRKWAFFAYFFCLGIGFMFMEISFMHYFIFFIGKPTYAFCVVLAAVLVFSSAGSLVSGRMKISTGPVIILLMICICTLFYALFLKYFFYKFLEQAFLSRIMLSLGILFPASFLMGFPFPFGLKLANRLEPGLLPWFWGINGCASVIASVLAMLVSVSKGYNVVMIAASFFYFAALIAVIAVKRSKTQPGTIRLL